MDEEYQLHGCENGYQISRRVQRGEHRIIATFTGGYSGSRGNDSAKGDAYKFLQAVRKD